MTIRYHCRHCETEIGSLPFESAQEALRLLDKLEEKEDDRFLVLGKGDALTVRTICEQCEQSLKDFPGYYAVDKWLQ